MVSEAGGVSAGTVVVVWAAAEVILGGLAGE